MKIKGLVIFTCIAIVTLTSFTKHSQKIEKKVNKEIALYFGTEEFSKETVKISESTVDLLKSEFSGDNLLRITNTSGILGYAYIGNAPSKTATFDYLVIFDKNFVIAKSKVLIYREEYGGEIGSKRWLKQFIGKTKDDEVKFTQDIDAISGATISSRSMTIAVGDLLKSIKVLHENKAL